VKVEAALLIGAVDGLLDFVPAVEVFLQTRCVDGSMLTLRPTVDSCEFRTGIAGR
jgi:hypothetical protein